MPVAETFAFLDRDGFSLSELARLDTLVTVVNGETFEDMIASAEPVARDAPLANGGDADPPRKLSDLLIEQVEYANVILVSRLDRIGHAGFERLRAILASLNPSARILPMQHGKSRPVGRPGYAALRSTGARRIAGMDATHAGRRTPIGIGCVRGPVVGLSRTCAVSSGAPARVAESPWTNGRLLRCKGYVWVAHRYAETAMLVQAGDAFQWGYVGRWWRFTPPSDWPHDDYRRDGVLKKWEEPAGDCRQEIVFIGQSIDYVQLRRELDACLLTVAEIDSGPASWRQFPEADRFDALATPAHS